MARWAVAGGPGRLPGGRGRVALSRGFELCLAVIGAPGIPPWAALSAIGMAAVILPPGIRDVILGPDGDEAGETGARQAAKRFIDEGRAVRIAPAPERQDFNDMLSAEARPA